MDDDKKLFEELLKADRIDPTGATESERAVFMEMLDSEQKRMKRLCWRTNATLWIFALALIGLCVSENILEALHIPFVVGGLVIMVAIWVVIIKYMPSHNRKIMESNRKISKLYYLVNGKHRGFPLVSRKKGKRIIHWFGILRLIAVVWVIMSLGAAGVWYLLCQGWMFSSTVATTIHILYCTAVSLSFVLFILHGGYKTPLDELTEIKAKSKQSKPDSRSGVWRIIMKSKITKFAVAAVIIIAALIGINQFGGSINLTTIALAEIVEMMELQPWIHAIANIRSPESEEQHAEHWIAFKRSIEVSKHTNGNIRYADSGLDELYLYDATKKTIIFSSMSDQYAMPRRTPLPESPIELIKQLINNVKEQGETTLSSETIFQDNREIEILHLVCHIPITEGSLIKQEVTLTVDAETHLLGNLQMVVMEEGKELATAYIEFRYPTEGPADIYLAGAPHDAKVINRRNTESSEQIRIDYQVDDNSQNTNQNTLLLYGDLTMELVYISPGEYYMGSAVDEIGYPERLLETYHKSKKKRVRELKHPSSEDPQHLVKIKNGFYLSRYEVTCEQFRKFKNEYRKGKCLIGSGRKHKSYELDADNQPAGVSLKDARKFCEWIGEKTGLNVALPCEAEWEYACRGGTQSRFYWGDSEKEAEQYANLADISYENGSPHTSYTLDTNDGNVCLAPVGQYLPNAFGLYDMIGNISEWVDGIYSNNAFSIDPDNKIFGKDKADNQEQYSRGGSWQADIINGRCSSRWIVPKDDMPGTRDSYIGFRVLIKEP